MDDPLIDGDGNRHSFLEQKLPMKRLVLSPNLYIVVFTPIGLICLVIGTVLLFAHDSAIEVAQEYGSICKIGSVCEITLKIAKKMEFPIAVLYELNNFYQNHWSSVSSRSDKQLMGDYVRFDDMKQCYPYRSINDDPSPNQWILPCGLQAVSFFNDVFEVKELKTLEIGEYQTTGIKVKSLNSMYKGQKWLENTMSWPSTTTLQRFSLWMDTAAFPNFRRLYGVATGKGYLEPGNITVTIQSNYNVSQFNGKKSIILTTKGSYTSSSVYLGIVYVTVGVVMQIAALITLITKPKLLAS